MQHRLPRAVPAPHRTFASHHALPFARLVLRKFGLKGDQGGAQDSVQTSHAKQNIITMQGAYHGPRADLRRDCGHEEQDHLRACPFSTNGVSKSLDAPNV